MSTEDDLPPPNLPYDEWLKTYDARDFAKDRVSLAVDVVLLTAPAGELHTYLVRRTDHPEYGKWVLPGGFVRERQTLEEAAHHVIETKVRPTGRTFLDVLRQFDNPDRDERTRVFTIAYVVRCALDALPSADGIYTRLAPLDGHKLASASGVDHLGFDHDDILASSLDYAHIAAGRDLFWPVPMITSTDIFTLAELSRVRENLGVHMTLDALRRVIASHERIEKHGWADGPSGKPVQTYRLKN